MSRDTTDASPGTSTAPSPLDAVRERYAGGAACCEPDGGACR